MARAIDSRHIRNADSKNVPAHVPELAEASLLDLAVRGQHDDVLVDVAGLGRHDHDILFLDQVFGADVGDDLVADLDPPLIGALLATLDLRDYGLIEGLNIARL
jgi:hypothetical protein